MNLNVSYIGKQIGNYRLLREIGGGSFGSIYLAEHTMMQERTVVVKFLRSLYLSSEEERQRFLQEARILERLKDHPHILSILDLGIADNVPYFLTSYAEHGSLRDRLKQRNNQPYTVAEALHIVTQIGEALHYAHEHNIVHRDMKPENILFDARDSALLADFGISAVLATASIKQAEVAGTPLYMAPEQFRGQVSKKSDQYALACILYELLSGRKPFEASDFVAMGFKHATQPAPHIRQVNASVPAHIEQALLKAMAKEHAERFISVQAFLVALQQPQQEASFAVPPVAPVTPRIDFHAIGDHGIPYPYAHDNAQPSANNDGAATQFTWTEQTTITPEPRNEHQSVYAIPAQWRLLAALCYLLPGIGWLIYLLSKRRNRFARFHAFQSFVFSLLSYTVIITLAANTPDSSSNPSYDSLSTLLGFICIFYMAILLIILVICLRGKYVWLPGITFVARKYADRKRSSLS